MKSFAKLNPFVKVNWTGWVEHKKCQGRKQKVVIRLIWTWREPKWFQGFRYNLGVPMPMIA